MAESMAKRAFIAGHPVSHSRSPMIHGYWLDRFGVDGSYERVDVEPSAFADFMRGLASSGFAGGNVTIPHKEAAFALAGWRDEAAGLIGAANTLWLDDGRVCAGNTDAAGLTADLDARAPQWRAAQTALVFGAGGAARAVLFALQQAGIGRIRLVNRTLDRARELADRFGGEITCHQPEAADELAGESAIVINTTALGMHGEDTPMADLSRLPDAAVVVDIVYTPLETPLLRAAAGRGLTTVDGLGMLLHQAVPGFERWFGRRPTVTDELRALVVADLERHR